MRSEIGYCVWVLQNHLWGKTLVDGKIRSQKWWQRKLEEAKNSPSIDIKEICNWECRTAEPAPIPFEQEMSWTEDTSEYWLGWLQQSFKYE